MPIHPLQQALWDRIVAHRFDDPEARLTFTARLARENGWAIGRAMRVVDEYRRFVFLAATTPQAVTPSEDVDQAWHLHLAYTHDYWHTFCGSVLRSPLHHGPTRGGTVEEARYDRQYKQTLDAYAAAFDTPPPSDIWPPPEQRFGADLAWRRVNVASNWVVPKPRWLSGGTRRTTRLVGLAAVPLMAAGIPNPLDLTGPPFLALFTALATGLASLAIAPQHPARNETAGGLPALTIAPEVPAGAPPDLRTLHARLAAIGNCTPVEGVKAAADVAAEEFEPSLVRRGLLVGDWWTTAAPWWILGPTAATLGLGIAKIAVGLSRGKPIGFLVIGCMALGLLGLLVLARKPRRTRQGDAVVHGAWQRFRESGQQQEWTSRRRTEAVAQPMMLMPLAVALFGTDALSGTTHAFLHAPVERLRTGDSGSGGFGCGSSGDGGGGCGGCGGGGD